MTDASVVPSERIPSVNPASARTQGHARRGSRRSLWRGYPRAGPSSQTQRRPLSVGLHVPTYDRGVRSFEITDGISKPGRSGRRTPPYAFIKQGVVMLSSVLRSERAIAVNAEIMRAFLRLRHLQLTNDDLGRKRAALERNFDRHGAQFQGVFQAIRELMDPSTKKRRPIGFRSKRESAPPRGRSDGCAFEVTDCDRTFQLDGLT